MENMLNMQSIIQQYISIIKSNLKKQYITSEVFRVDNQTHTGHLIHLAF